MKVRFNKRFQKSFEKTSLKIKRAFALRLDLFIKDRFNKLLNNHSLNGGWENYFSINITGDWRAIYRRLDDTKVECVEFVEIGTHSELYE